jgi:hypothetical protein
MPTPAAFDLDNLAASLEAPVLIVSTVVGRGMYTLGEALQESFTPGAVVGHMAVEDYLPGSAVAEDLKRYKFISDRLPFLLYLVYKLPVFYYRKYLRESLGGGSDLGALGRHIEALNPRTVLCVSHRPAFWVSSLKRRAGLGFKLWGVLGEYGNTLAWRYIFWEQMDGFLSPLERGELTYAFPGHLRFEKIDLPARRAYYGLADRPGDPRGVLLVCGYWGQGPILRVLRTLLGVDPALRITAVCGENGAARAAVRRAFGDNPNIRAYGAVDSLLPFFAECSCVVTKPGISTLLEARAARRKIFLLKGMPVAEGNNARHAVRHFGAEWFSEARFREWRKACATPAEKG